MADLELIMPKMGESIMEATILKWLKKEGDQVKADESVLEIATDKVDSEVPSPFEGTLTKLLYKEGDVVPVGKAIAVISSGAVQGVQSTNGIKGEAPRAEKKPEPVSTTTTSPVS